ncbi:hypothetical protein Pcinc_043110 [Petrolisthes cinctipes]|uniref:Ionotropic glutamate receptor L-glutamate and glycine-binding domain-containing protein n=1 Tax=Petrolisthes cinctipes TaxID=88211 RepID=A0AAE1BJS7_PETCI|nr:hypothetical protein Pcinc_043110 [Petrolisthes cinctipes]
MFLPVQLRGSGMTMLSLPWVTLTLAALLTTYSSAWEELSWSKGGIAATRSHLLTPAAADKETTGKIDHLLSTTDGTKRIKSLLTTTMRQGVHSQGTLITPTAPDVEKNASLLAITESVGNKASLQTDEGVEGGWREVAEEGVGDLIRDIIVTNRLETCHLLVVTEGRESSAFSSILMSLEAGYLAGVVVDSQLPLTNPLLQALKKGDAAFSCRVLLVDLPGAGTSITNVMEILESSHLYLWPYTRVILYGTPSSLTPALLHPALRNTVHALYLSREGLRRRVEEEEVREDVGRSVVKEMKRRSNDGDGGNGMENSVEAFQGKDSDWTKCYLRCLYCEGGRVGIRLVDRWSPHTSFKYGPTHLFDPPPTNFRGHEFNIVTLDWYPFMDFTRDSDAVATTVTPQDSLDFRILTAIASSLNFTYEMRVPWDDQWGTSTPSGNWTGVVGTLQHHKADFSLLLSWMRGRYQVVEYSRIYVNEPIVMIMAKPGPLPQYLALVRPLTGELWAAVLVSTFTGGLILWLLQWTWARACGGVNGFTLGASLLYTWSILFEEPPPTHCHPIYRDSTVFGQMFVGWWWVYCTLVTVVYRSSLIAHLSVPGTSTTIDSFQELLREEGWTWGYEPSYGAGSQHKPHRTHHL